MDSRMKRSGTSIRLRDEILSRPAMEEPIDGGQVQPTPAVTGVRLDPTVSAYVGLVLVAFLLRLLFLGDKPMHHDESQDAYFSWLLYSGHGYAYDPILHGPLRFYLMGLTYLLFGVSDFTARVAPALFGTALVALPYFLRRQIGSIAAFGAAVLLCLSPAYLYFSRFAREDIYVAAITLGLLVAVFLFLDQPRRWHPAVILGLLAASFATKETTFITAFVAGTFLIAAIAWQWWQARTNRPALVRMPLLSALRSVGPDAWIWGLASFALVYTLLFSSFLFHPLGLRDGLIRGIQYWLSQQPVQRGGQPWFYYLVLLVAYSWPELILGAIGAVAVLRRPTLIGIFLIWAFGLSLAVYSWAGEKMPWLLLHPLLPLLLLAGIGIQVVWDNRRSLAGKLGLGIAAIGAVYLVHATSGLSYNHPADPRELLVFTQSSVDVPQVREQLLALDRRTLVATGRHLEMQVDSWGGATWPWAWTLRDPGSAGFVDMSQAAFVPSAQALVVTDPNRQRLLPYLASYTGYRFQLRVWWVQDYSRVTPRSWVRWLLWREPWSPLGSFDEWLYVRNDVPGRSLIGA
jgi:uncharacterized protein (TIGR03663 family)